MLLLRFVVLLLSLVAAGTSKGEIAFRSAASASSCGYAAAPAFVAAGTAQAGTGAASVPWPAHVADDIGLLFVETDDENVATPAGWTAVANSPQSAAGDTRLSVFWRRATAAGTANATFADPGNHFFAQILVYRGVITTGNPWDATAGGARDSGATSSTVTAVTTTVCNTRVVVGVARDNDANGAFFASLTNANLTGITERVDGGTNQSNGGGFAVWDATFATPGSTGTSTASSAPTSIRNAWLTIALRAPAVTTLAVNVPAGTVEEDVMLASIAVAPSGATVTAPAGWTELHNTAGTSNRLVTYQRVAGATEPASYTWTLGGTATTGAAGGIATYVGVDTLTPIHLSAANTTASGTTHTATGVTTTVASTMVVTAHSFASSVAWTPPAGMTERVDVPAIATTNAEGVALEMNDVAQAAAGATGDKSATVGSNGDNGAAHIVVLRSSEVLQLRLDESTWSSYPPQDSSGNGLHGTANAGANTAGATPAIAGAVGTCRYGSFNGSTSYVEVAHNALLNMTGRFTVMAWINPNAVGPDALKTIVSKDENFEFHLTSGGEINWWWENAGGTAQEIFTAGAGITAGGGWYHIAVVYTPGAQTIYVNGVVRGSGTFTGGLMTNTDPLQVGSDQGLGGRFFDGQVDEVRVFRHALTAGEVGAAMGATRACTIHHTHYSVSYPNGTNFATCEPGRVRVTAHDAAHVAVAPPPGTLLSVSTSSANGVWLSPLITGINANWTVPGTDTGTATYAWDGDGAFIEMDLRRNVATTLHLNLADGSGRSEGAGGEDPSIVFADSVLRVTADGSASANIDTQVAGKRNSEGSGIQALFVQAVATAPATGACTTLFQNQTRAIEFAAVCNNPTTCADPDVNDAPLFEIFSGDGTGAAVNIQKNNNTVTPASYSSVSLNFSNDANAMAPLVFRYGDAGQVTLHLRYTLPAPPATTISGTSNAFVVRPFGIAVRGANAGVAIAHGTTEAAAVLAAAGDPFTLTLAAYKWTSALEDANANGVPDFAAPDVVDITDNDLTPNFAADVSLSALSNLPGVALGEIRRGVGCLAATGTVSAGSWSGGAVTINDACYTEAGNVKIAVFATDYIVPGGGISVFGLSSFDGSGFTGGHVGRFRPKHFAVSGATLANRHGASCAPASSFSYMDEDLRLSFTLTAQNAQNATTANYDGVYAKLGLTTFGNWSLGARSGTTNLTGRLDTGVAPTGSWSNGVASGILLTTAVNRASPDVPDGPYTSISYGIAPTDSDGVAMNTLDLDVDNNAAMDRKNLGALTDSAVRFGRLRLQNALGSAKLVLPMPVRAEFWNGSAFAVNTLDSCTTLARDAFALGSYTGALDPGGGNCKTFIQQDPVTITAGLGTLTLAAPTGAASGSVLVTPQLRSPAAGFSCDNASSGEDAISSALRPYLLGRWNDAANPDADANTAYDDNPSGRASFGVYGSQPNNYIYFRENY
ncbi:MAG: DUF6701 domain-containing protein [Betaproteobacteria bacterium]